MIASNNIAMQTTANELFILNADEIAREQARAREDAIMRETSLLEALTEKDQEIAQLKAKLAELESRK